MARYKAKTKSKGGRRYSTRRAGGNDGLSTLLTVLIWIMIGVILGTSITVGFLFLLGYLPRTVTVIKATAVILDTYSIIF